MQIWLFVLVLWAIALCLVIFEYSSYKRCRNTQSRKKLIRRIMGSVIIFFIGLMILFGLEFLKENFGISSFIIYWGICLFLVLILVFIAILDVKNIFKDYLSSEMKVLREMKSLKNKDNRPSDQINN